MNNATEDRTAATISGPYTRADLERNIPIMASVWFGAVLEASDVNSITEDLVQRFGPKVLAGKVDIGHIGNVIRDHIPAEHPCQTYRMAGLQIVEMPSFAFGETWTVFPELDTIGILRGLSEDERRRVLAEALTEMVRRSSTTA
jgi:hypothetical protein